MPAEYLPALARAENFAVRFAAPVADTEAILTRVRAFPVDTPAPDPTAARGLKFAAYFGDDLAAIVLRHRLADPAAVRAALVAPVKATSVRADAELASLAGNTSYNTAPIVVAPPRIDRPRNGSPTERCELAQD